jgi:hypothetical protein
VLYIRTYAHLRLCVTEFLFEWADISCSENRDTFYVQSLFFENRAVYEIMWKNTVERGRPHVTIWGMSITCWITKATNTHSEYVILIPFLLQQWLHDPAKVFLHTYIAGFDIFLITHLVNGKNTTWIRA